MDSNRGDGSEGSDERARPTFGGEAGRPATSPAQGDLGNPGWEFSIQDPVRSFLSTARGVILDPVAFFQGINRQGDFVNPVVFALICFAVSAILGGLLTLILNPAFGLQTFGQALIGFLIALVVYPLIGAIFVFAAAGILFVLVVLIVRPSGTGFETTLRTVSYASAAQLVAWVPFVGLFAWFIWFVVLAILGTREMHTTSTGRAAAVVLIPVAVALIIFFLLAALGVAVFLDSQQ